MPLNRLCVALWCLAMLAWPAESAAQVVLQDFEVAGGGLRYDQCYTGDNVDLTSSDVPLQGTWRLQAGPLNKNKEGWYQTPFLTLPQNGFVRFKHRNESNGNKSDPVLFVDLMRPDGSLAVTIYQYPYPPEQYPQPVVAQPQVPSAGVYRIRFRFAGQQGSERIGLDELNIDGQLATTGFPACGPMIPGTPPTARPDVESTTFGEPVVARVLLNDLAGTDPIDSSTVDLRPEDPTGIIRTRDIKNAIGIIIGTAQVDGAGNVTVSAIGGFTGTLQVPYNVRDVAGRVSNQTTLTVTVGQPTADASLQLAGPVNAVTGDDVAYTATIVNLGPADAASSQVSFAVSGPLGPLSVTCPGRAATCGTPVISSGAAVVPMTGLAANEVIQVVLSATSTAAGTVTVESVVAVDTPTLDPNPNNNRATLTTTLIPLVTGADLVTQVTGPTDGVYPGGIVSYSVTIGNAGPDNATGVTVTGTAARPGSIPVTFLVNTGDCVGAYPCALGTIPVGATRSFVSHYRVSLPAGQIPPFAPLVFTATGSAVTTDPDPGNNTASASSRVVVDVDVGLSIDRLDEPVPIGQTVDFTLVAANGGPVPARDVPVVVTYTAGLVPLAAHPSSGTVDPATGRWVIPEVGPGSQEELRVTFRVTAPGPQTVSQELSPAPPTDVQVNNDYASSTIEGVPSADVAVRLTASTLAPSLGSTMTVTLYVGNYGPSPATAVTLQQRLPVGLRYTGVQPAGFEPTTGTWTSGTLAPGAVVSLTTQVAVDVLGPLVIVASTGHGVEADPNPLNNFTALALNANASADLQVTLAVDDDSPVTGQVVTITATLINAGPSASADTVVTFGGGPPGALAILTATPSSGSLNGVTWTLGTMAAGASATVTAQARIEVSGAIVVTAHAASTTTDPAPQSNDDELQLNGQLVGSVLEIDFEDATSGAAACWVAVGMAVGGLTPAGQPLGRAMLNPPLQLLLHLVSNPLSIPVSTQTFESPWLELNGQGAIAFLSKVNNASSQPRLIVTLVNVADESETLLLDRAYQLADAGVARLDSIPVGVSGIFKVRWRFSGVGGVSRGAIDDIRINGRQVSAVQPPDVTGPYDCRPVVPGDTPPVAVPDFFSTTPGVSVVAPLLANDRPGLAPSTPVNPASVTLDPTDAVDRVSARDVLRSDGVLLGRASVDDLGNVTFAPTGGVTGSGAILYAVRSTAGSLSNVALATFIVGDVSADMATAVEGPATAPVGARVAYRVLARNLGPTSASATTVSGAVSGGLRLISVTCAPGVGYAVCGTPTIAGDSFSVTVSGPSFGGSVALDLVTTAPPVDTVVQVAASAQLGSGTDPNPGNDSASLTTTIGAGPPVPRADLVVTKTGPAQVTVGERAAYRMVVTNVGPDTAVQATLSDPGPPDFVRTRMTGACATFPCALGNLPVGAARTIDVEYTAGLAGGTRQSLALNAALTSSQSLDPNLLNNLSVVQTRVVQAWDLRVEVAADSIAVPLGQLVTLTFIVENTGPNAAAGVAASVVIPAGITAESVSASQGTYAGGVWSVGTLQPVAVAELRIVGTVAQTGAQSASATLTGGLESDTNAANNEASLAVTGLPAADIALASSASDVSPLVGDVVTLHVEVANRGPSDATDLVVTGVAPAGLAVLAVTPSVGTFALATGEWAIGPLSAGAAATLSASVRVERAGTFNTQAVVTHVGEFDPELVNNSTGIVLSGGETADVGIDVAADPPNVVVGQAVRLTLTASNDGPNDAPNTVARMSIPPALSVASASPSLGVIDANGAWLLGTLAAGARATLILDAIVVGAGSPLVTTLILSDLPDRNPVNNVATASLNAGVGADVRLTVLAATAEAPVSQRVTVYVVATNEGPGTATGLTAGVTLPSALQLATATASQGTVDIASAQWSIGTLAPGAQAQLTLTVIATDFGSHPIRATLPPWAGELDLANNVSGAVIDIPSSLNTVADLRLQITPPASIPPGGQGAFVAEAYNAGSTYAVDLTIALTVPTGAGFVSAVPTFGGGCVTPPAGSPGDVVCTWPGQCVVGRGRLRAVALVVSGAAAAPGATIDVRGEVRSLTQDPFLSNNVAVARTVVIGAGPSTDIAISKSAESGGTATAVRQGERLRYRVTAINQGSVIATGVRIAERTAPLIVTGAVASTGTVDGATQTWTIPALSPGAVATLDVEVAAPVSGQFALPTSRIASDVPDSNAANDVARLMVDVVAPGLGSRYVATGNLDGLDAKEIVTGAGYGEVPEVRVFDGSGRPRLSFYAYDPRFLGGVRVAACDIDGDGRDEIVTGAGPGGGPHVRVFDLYAGQRVVEVISFYAQLSTYPGGVNVACDDVTGDGQPEIIVGSGSLGPEGVAVWTVRPFSIEFQFAYPVFDGAAREVRVATCDVNGDGRADILAGSGAGRPAEVWAIDPVTPTLLGTLRPLEGFAGGTFVACGELSSQVPGPEVVVAADAGGPPRVDVYSASGAPLASVLASAPTATGGTRVAVGDVDAASPLAELITGAGSDSVPIIQIASGFSGVLVELRSFVAPNLP